MFTGEKSQLAKAALTDFFATQLCAARGEIHLEAPLAQAIEDLKNDDDIKTASFFLMSVTTKTEAGSRLLETSKYLALLDHPKVKNSPQLDSAIRKAGENIQLRAIRHAQSKVVWQLSLDRENKKKWQQAANGVDISKHLDANGIGEIARRVGVKLPDDYLTNPEVLEQMKNLDLLLKQKSQLFH